MTEAGRVKPALRPISPMISRCRSTPTGAPMAPPTSPVTTTEAMTIAMVCRGVMPSALCTPRSWTRSRVSRTTMLSTPSAATVTSISGEQGGQRVDDEDELGGVVLGDSRATAPTLRQRGVQAVDVARPRRCRA